MNIVFENIVGFLLVFVRMTAMIAFNPMFARRNVPQQVRMGLVLFLTIVLTPTVDASPMAGLSELEIFLSVFRELTVGLVIGFIFQIFYYMLFFAGDVLDVQIGMSMAKVFDPSSSIQMSVTGSYFSYIFILYIFATNSHLMLINMFAKSYNLIPMGVGMLNLQIADFVFSVFTTVFVLAIKLIIPLAVAEFTVEAAMGVLMKVIPQIHVFVINVQFKMIIGLLLLFAFVHPMSAFIDNYIVIMFDKINLAMQVLVR